MATPPIIPLFLEDPTLFRLREVAQPPRALYALGDASGLDRPAIAIVGTRRPSAYGLRAAMHFSRALASLGFAIVSGLAKGIDTAAHRGALSGGGYTVAVLGHGLDRVYPVVNTSLAHEIVSRGGCLLSEYAPGVPPLKHHFPERNRIIAGLALGTLVIEAAPKSGSLITARHALEQNREVFAVAGAFDDGGFEGSHQLVKRGAKLVTTPEDLLDEMPACFVEKAARYRTEAAPIVTQGRLPPLFQGEPSASLQELFESFEGTLPELLQEIEAAERQGLVEKIAPQIFLWLGPR